MKGRLGRGEYVHRLVLLAFIGPEPDGLVGCHNDGDPTNNHLSNLRWDTMSGNQQDAVTHGTHASTAKTHCKRGHPLEHPNLVTAPSVIGRQCVACMRARGQAHKLGVPVTQQMADEYYEWVMTNPGRAEGESSRRPWKSRTDSENRE